MSRTSLTRRMNMVRSLMERRKRTLADVIQQNIANDTHPVDTDIWFYLWVDGQLPERKS